MSALRVAFHLGGVLNATGFWVYALRGSLFSAALMAALVAVLLLVMEEDDF